MDKLNRIYKAFKTSGKVSTDTRMDVKDSVFFALSGENFDGNKFAEIAIKKGATLAIIDNPSYAINDDYMLVEDVLKSLQDLATTHRKTLNTKILAITGSNGKTTTKELISAVLVSEKKTVSTKGNLNNHIGVPLSILRIKDDTDIGVIEMGANHQGEIKRLCEIALPNTGIITNIGKAHLEGFGSFDGVISAKNELYEFIKSTNGEIIRNSDDQILLKLGSEIDSLIYGSDKADVTGELLSSNPTLKVKWNFNGEEYLISSKLYGSYNFSNIMAAVASGIYFGISPANITKAIELYQPSNNRSQLINTSKNNIVLDAYNANPVSMNNAIASFKDFNAESPVLILGDMFELGESAGEEHKKIVDLLQEIDFKEVFLVGEEFFNIRKTNDFMSFRTTEDLRIHFDINILKNKNILIKGSRGMKLESLLDIL